jgi:hypothetical protein
MSHHFIVPANENGVLLDQTIGTDVETALDPVLGFNDVFLFSHGWWTDAIRAMEGYNRFTIEFSQFFRSRQELRALQVLSIGLHWPSMLSENQLDLLNYFQALSFYTMEKRADSIGENAAYALLRTLLQARSANAPLRLHLLGHSFGCKVVCRALQRLADAGALPANTTCDMVLLQAAFDNNKLEPDQDYGKVLTGYPGLRLLITTSAEDSALGNLYPTAHRLVHLFGTVQPALGHDGPTEAVVAEADGATRIVVGPNFDPSAAGDLSGRLVVADLTPLHQANTDWAGGRSGHHSDIFHKEIYALLVAFYFRR